MKWQYMVVHFDEVRPPEDSNKPLQQCIEDTLEWIGEEGYELVSVTDLFLYFKRPFQVLTTEKEEVTV